MRSSRVDPLVRPRRGMCHPEHQEVRGPRGRWPTRQNPQRTLWGVAWGVRPGAASENRLGGASLLGAYLMRSMTATTAQTGGGLPSPSGGFSAMRGLAPACCPVLSCFILRDRGVLRGRGSWSSGRYAGRDSGGSPVSFFSCARVPVASRPGARRWRDVASCPVPFPMQNP